MSCDTCVICMCIYLYNKKSSMHFVRFDWLNEFSKPLNAPFININRRVLETGHCLNSYTRATIVIKRRFLLFYIYLTFTESM